MTVATLASGTLQASAATGTARKSKDALGTAMAFVVIAVVMAAPVPLASNRPFLWAFWTVAVSGLLLLWCMFGDRRALSWRNLSAGQKANVLLASAYGIFLLVQVLPLGIVAGPFVFRGPSGETFNSITPSLVPGDTWHAVLRWFTFCSLFLLVVWLAGNRSRARLMQVCVAMIVGVHALWGLLALHLFGDTLLFLPKWTYEGVATGTFVNRNSFATFLGLGAVSATALLANRIADPGNAERGGGNARLAPAVPWLALLLLIMACLLQTQSRMGILATMAGIAVTLLFFVRRPAQLLVPTLAILLAGAAMYFVQGGGLAERFGRTGPDWDHRLALYGQVVGMIMERPLAGYGAGSFAQAYPLFHAPPVANSVTWDHAHSTYLALFVGAGIPAGLIPVILAGALVLRIARHAAANGARLPQTAAAVGAAVLVGIHALVDFSLEIQAVAMLFVVVVALGLAACFDSAAPGMHARDTAAGAGSATAEVASQRARLAFDTVPEVIYAIGDVHGELELLSDLERRIAEDAASVRGEKWIIQLGDLIDRGPRSADVIDHMLDRPPPGFRRFCIAGNHEIMMLKAIAEPQYLETWLKNGGVETLASYGMSRDEIRSLRSAGKGSSHLIESFVPREHLGFLAALPAAIETPRHLFVHAGMAPGKPLSQQSDRDLTLTGRDFLDLPAIHRKVIVHGHHVVENACYRNNRISIDTGAYLSGRLTAVRIESGGKFRFIAGPKASP